MINVNRFRKIQTVISIILFIVVFFLFWDVTKFKLDNIQLSYWGVQEKIGWIWNLVLALLSISIFINLFYYVKHHPRLYFKGFIQLTFLFVSLCLFITGVVDISHEIHTTMTYLYFFSYPLAIFLLSHLNRKHLQYKEWLTHVIFSIIMVVSPLLVIKLFDGMAISESIHAVVVICWNIWILFDD